MSINIEKFFAFYSHGKVFYCISYVFVISLIFYFTSIHMKIMRFYSLNHDIHRIEMNMSQTKQKILLSRKKIFNKKNTIGNKALTKRQLDVMEQLIETIKKTKLILYRISGVSKREEECVHIETLNLSLTGQYHQVIQWLARLSPSFCHFKNISMKKMYNGSIKLMIDVEMYYE